MEIPTLRTDRLTLRPFDAGDALPLYHILRQDGILRYFPTTVGPSLDRVEALVERQLAHWQEHGLGWWAVQPDDQPELVGWNGLQHLPETDEVEIGYLLSRDFWGMGLATEGARAGLRFGFQTVGLETIIGLVHPENARSAHVLEKLGMTCTGPAGYFEMDVVRYEIGVGDWVRGIRESDDG